jgi:hypothetical protein
MPAAMKMRISMAGGTKRYQIFDGIVSQLAPPEQRRAIAIRAARVRWAKEKRIRSNASNIDWQNCKTK